MNQRIFADTAQRYKDAGYGVIPLNGKEAFIPGFQAFAHNPPGKERLAALIREHANKNIGVVTGTYLPDGTMFAAFDVDIDGKVLDFIKATLGNCPAIRRGQKGGNIYMRIPKGMKTRTFKMFGIQKPVGSILTNGAQSVLPPSLHPDTGLPYVWISEKELWECAMSELPFATAEKLDYIFKVLGSEQCAQLLLGSPTNDAAFTLAATGVAHLVDEETWCRSILALLPEGYNGNLAKELPRHHHTAIDKGLGKQAVDSYEHGTEGPIPLGCTKDDRYAFLDQRLNVIKVKTSKQLASAADLLELGTAEFWSGIASSAKSVSGFSAFTIADMLIRASMIKGKIDPSRIRGIGVWREKDGKIIKNFSGPVPARGWYVYTRFEEFESLEGKHIKPEMVLAWLQRFKWKIPDYAIVLLGWLAYAPICGALKQRPHLFLTGPKNSGKTTLLIGIEGLLDPLVLKFDGSVTTEAGIRQKLEENARPIIIDEFEADHMGSRKRIMNLARSAFSANAAGVKGTPSGKHMEFLITSSFLFAGINILRENAANSSRMFVAELEPHDNDPLVNQQIESDRQNFTDQQTDWSLRRIDQVETTLAAISAFGPLMPEIDSRAKNNLSICFGSAFVALEGRLPTDKEIKTWIKKYKNLIDHHSMEHEQNDSEDCKSHLLSHVLLDRAEKPNVWELIAETNKIPVHMRKDSGFHDPLQSYGMRIEDDRFWVADNHSYLERIFKDTNWAAGGWKHQLVRLEGAVQGKKYYQGHQKRSVGIPLVSLRLEGARPIRSRFDL